MIELITESETLRKIQVSSGVTGSFKDRTIKEWLQKHNPTGLEYNKVHTKGKGVEILKKKKNENNRKIITLLVIFLNTESFIYFVFV